MNKKKALWMTLKLVERFSHKDMVDALFWNTVELPVHVVEQQAVDELYDFRGHMKPVLEELLAKEPVRIWRDKDKKFIRTDHPERLVVDPEKTHINIFNTSGLVGKITDWETAEMLDHFEGGELVEEPDVLWVTFEAVE